MKYSILATRDDSCGSGGQSMAELNKGIRREMTRLSERWPALLHHTDMWQAKLDDMLPVISASQNTVRRFSIKHGYCRLKQPEI